MGVDITVWGPCSWKFLHTLSFAYPVKASRKRMKSMHTFLHAFAQCLPCNVCARHMASMLQERLPQSTSEHLAGRDSLTRFIVELHNAVNERLSKPIHFYSDVYREYMHDEPTEDSLCGLEAHGEDCAVDDAVDVLDAAASPTASARAARVNVSSDAHDLTLLISCAVGVTIVCLLMIAYGLWAGKRRRH